MMKKALFILLLAAPMALFAQTKKTTDTKSKDKDSKEVVTKEKTDPAHQIVSSMRMNENLYVEVVVAGAGGTGAISVKVILGANYKLVVQDKQMVEGLESAAGMRYSNVIDALNVLNALGFRLITSYDLPGRNGSESHLVLEAANKSPELVMPEKGVGNTLSKDPGLSTKSKGK
jgi:hypothetical protein